MRVHLGSGLVTCKAAGSTEEPIASRSPMTLKVAA
jgi:hypothetical protein